MRHPYMALSYDTKISKIMGYSLYSYDTKYSMSTHIWHLVMILKYLKLWDTHYIGMILNTQ